MKSIAADPLHCSTQPRQPAFSLNHGNCPKLPKLLLACLFVLLCFFSWPLDGRSLFLCTASRFLVARPPPIPPPPCSCLFLPGLAQSLRTSGLQDPNSSNPRSTCRLHTCLSVRPSTALPQDLCTFSCCPPLGPSRALHRCHLLKGGSALGICLLRRGLWVPSTAEPTNNTFLFQKNPRQGEHGLGPQRL